MDSAGGRPFLEVKVRDSEDREGLADFNLRYLDEFLEKLREEYYEPPRGYPSYQRISYEGKGYYIRREYTWQTTVTDCTYHVVEHVVLSNDPKANYGFIITAGICEDDLAVYGRQRESILSSFNEIE